MKLNSRNGCFYCRPARHTNRESGVALILALICLMLISALAAAIIFSTQSELWTTANYRSVTQARYGAEAGLQQTVNWLQSTWVAPASPNNLDGTNFSLTTFPVKYKGGTCSTSPYCNVVINASAQGLTGTYAFDSATNSTFATAFTTTALPLPAPLPANVSSSFTPTYTVSAQLLEAENGGSAGWITTWKVFSQGNVGNAKVQLVAIVNKVLTTSSSSNTAPSFKAAVLATGTGCGPSNKGVVDMNGGNNHTDSYDSSLAANKNNKSPATIGNGGDVIAYGNLNISSGAKIYGNLFTPQYNVGPAGTYGISNTAGGGMAGGAACGAGGVTYAVNEDNSGSQVGCTSSACPDANSGWYGGPPYVYNQRTYALPAGYTSIPDPTMPTAASNTAAASGYGGCLKGSSGDATTGWACKLTIPPNSTTSYGAVTIAGAAVIRLTPGVYIFDSLSLTAGGSIAVPVVGDPDYVAGGVQVYIMNTAAKTTPLSFNGGTVANNGQDPNNLSFIYNGNQTVDISAGTNVFATIYAPHAAIVSSGGTGLYGAVVGSTFSFSGSGKVTYDQNLGKQNTHIPVSGSTPTATPMHIDQFSWSAY